MVLSAWQETVFFGDDIWRQVKLALTKHGLELPTTPRRPDIRLIVNNLTGQTLEFLNPGKHSDKPEIIPPTGDDTAVMIMMGGETLADQQINAALLTKRYQLGEKGITQELIDDLPKLVEEGKIAEAYGPAPYQKQADRLVMVEWKTHDKRDLSISPEVKTAAAYGARAPEQERAIHTSVKIYVQGSSTTPELMEVPGMVLAVSEDWKTGEESTRPIVPSIAEEFYGNDYSTMPIVIVDTYGEVQSIDLNNGTIIEFDADSADPVVTNAPNREGGPGS